MFLGGVQCCDQFNHHRCFSCFILAQLVHIMWLIIKSVPQWQCIVLVQEHETQTAANHHKPLNIMKRFTWWLSHDLSQLFQKPWTREKTADRTQWLTLLPVCFGMFQLAVLQIKLNKCCIVIHLCYFYICLPLSYSPSEWKLVLYCIRKCLFTRSHNVFSLPSCGIQVVSLEKKSCLSGYTTD